MAAIDTRLRAELLQQIPELSRLSAEDLEAFFQIEEQLAEDRAAPDREARIAARREERKPDWDRFRAAFQDVTEAEMDAFTEELIAELKGEGESRVGGSMPVSFPGGGKSNKAVS